MLAQNFKTPAELGISSAEFCALATVLGMLERGEILTPPPNAKMENFFAGDIKRLKYFDMESTAHRLDCGTAGCLLGWAWHIAGSKNVFASGGQSIRALFLPGRLEARECRDVRVAALALRNYLSTGEPRWDEAIAFATPQ